MRPAVFLDRDGTLCRESGYINHPDRLELVPGGAAAVRAIRELGFAAVIVTNQAGIARGYFPRHVLDETHARLRALLAAEGTALDGIYACVHHPDVGGPGYRRTCPCRKPRPGMLLQAARELDLDLARSYMVGDSFRDVGAGRAAGVAKTVLLRSGYGRGELLWKGNSATAWPDRIEDDIGAAVRFLAAEAGGQP